MKASIHRFRLRRLSPSPGAIGRARSASPPVSADQREAQARGQHHTAATQKASGARNLGAKTTPPACDRCRSFKKKCSRTFPVCSLCATAGQRCSYTSPIANAEAQIHQLRSRVEWLSQYIDQNILPPGPQGRLDGIETGVDLVSILGRGSQSSIGTVANPESTSPYLPRVLGPNTPPLDATAAQPLLRSRDEAPAGQQNAEIRVEERDPGSVRTTSSHFSPYQGSTEGSTTRRRLIARQALPPDIAPYRFVDAFFRHVNRAYPFVDQARVRRDLETLGDASPADQDPPMTLLYLVMAIGCTSLVRAGQIPSDTARQFDVVYPDIIQECLCSESVE
jgi:hypothetical protein